MSDKPKSSSPGERLTEAEIDEAIECMTKHGMPTIVFVESNAECSCDVGPCDRHPWRNVSKMHPLAETQEERHARVLKVLTDAGYMKHRRHPLVQLRTQSEAEHWWARVEGIFAEACYDAPRAKGARRREIVRVIATCSSEIDALASEQEGSGS